MIGKSRVQENWTVFLVTFLIAQANIPKNAKFLKQFPYPKSSGSHKVVFQLSKFHCKWIFKDIRGIWKLWTWKTKRRH